MTLKQDEAQEQKDLERLAAEDEKAAKAAAKPPPPPKALSATESLGALKAHVAGLRVMLARGSKSDIDAIAVRLSEVEAWIDGIADDKRDNPRSVAHALEPSHK